VIAATAGMRRGGRHPRPPATPRPLTGAATRPGPRFVAAASTAICDLHRSEAILPEDPQRPRYPDIQVQLSGEDGNAFAILGRTAQALRRAGVAHEEIDDYFAEATSGDYDHLLQTTMGWVDCQ
jgi:hypothetical protein